MRAWRLLAMDYVLGRARCCLPLLLLLPFPLLLLRCHCLCTFGG